MLRAPLAKGEGALNWCRDRKARPITFPIILKDKQPPDVFSPAHSAAPDRQGEAAPTFQDTRHGSYRAMLQIIEKAREEVLKQPRIDMPGAVVIRGQCRELPAPKPLAEPLVSITPH